MPEWMTSHTSRCLAIGWILSIISTTKSESDCSATKLDRTRAQSASDCELELAGTRSADAPTRCHSQHNSCTVLLKLEKSGKKCSATVRQGILSYIGPIASAGS